MCLQLQYLTTVTQHIKWTDRIELNPGMPLTETPFYTLLPSVPDTQSMYLAVIYKNTVSVLRSRICITGKSWIRIRFKIIRIIFLDLIPIIVKS